MFKNAVIFKLHLSKYPKERDIRKKILSSTAVFNIDNNKYFLHISCTSNMHI